MNVSELSSSSFLNCFASEPDPIAWSFVLQTLIPVSNIKDLAKEVPKSNISDLESILKDAKLLRTFLKGTNTDCSPEPTNDCRSSNIELFDDYAEDEVELLKVVSTCLVPEDNKGPVAETGNAVLHEGPSLTEKGDAVLHEGPSLTEKGDAVLQESPSLTEKGDAVLQEGLSEEAPLVPGNDNSIVQNVHFVPTNNNDVLQKTPPVTKNDDETMQVGCPVNENSNEIMQKSCPVDEYGNLNMPKDHPVMENSVQIMPESQQMSENVNANMPKAHPVTENGDEGIPQHHIITDKGDEIMPGPSATGNVNKNFQGPQALENDNDKLPNNYCLKCHRGGSLVMCEVENCSTSFHERCVVYLERNEMGTFKCPLCFYKHTAIAYHKAKERYSQAKKSLANFLLKDTAENRFDKKKSSKLNDDMIASGSNRKRKRRTEIQVKIEAVETETYCNGPEANCVQQQAIDDNAVNMNKRKIKADVDAVSLINGTHDKGEASKIQSKDMPLEVLNMPVQRVREETIHNEVGRDPRISK